MARLSRTNKFADLREQMSNDREASVYTDELSRYQNRLRDVQTNANVSYEDVLNRPVGPAPTYQQAQVYQQPGPMYQQQTPVYQQQAPVYQQQAPVSQQAPVQQAPVYTEPVQAAQPVEPTPVVKEVKPVVEEVPAYSEITKEFNFDKETSDDDFFSFLNSLDTVNLDKDIQESIDKVPVAEFEETKVMETPVKSELEPVFEEAMKEIGAVVEPEPKVEEVIIEAPPKEPEVIIDTKDDFQDIARYIEKDNAELNGEVEPVKEEKPVINNDFLANAIKEVDDYNRQDGRKTIDELSTSMVDAVRHPETNSLSSKDDEFSNTVSLEIDKVLNEIKTEPAPTPKAPEVKPVEPKVEEKIESTIEHPVLAKKLEEDVVEIKSMEETLKQEILDDTIPFVMNSDDETPEEYEDEAPNKVLNVILVILIVILLAILGVIVYYILYAKGIIG